MSQFKYDGESERVIATLGIVVNTGDVFEAPDDFSAYGFSSVTNNNKKVTAPAVIPEPSALPDATVGE